MEEKMANDEFIGDTVSLLCPDEKYYPNEAYEIVKAQIIDKLIVLFADTLSIHQL